MPAVSPSTESQIGPQSAYEAWLAQGLFMIQRSRSTGAYVFWPRLADHLGTCDLEWVKASGRGTIYASTVTRRQGTATNVILVTLEEGPRMMSCVPGVEIPPIGAAVQARIENHQGSPRVIFDLMKADGQ